MYPRRVSHLSLEQKGIGLKAKAKAPPFESEERGTPRATTKAGSPDVVP